MFPPNQNPQMVDEGTSPFPRGQKIKPEGVKKPPMIQRDSFRAALMTSIEYVSNDLQKKQKQFFMIVTTVFLTVSFLTFLSLIGQLAPIQLLLQTESISGDYDVMIMGNMAKKEPIYSSKNFYVDDQEFFKAKSLDQIEMQKKMDKQAILSKIPFVNFTLIQDTVDEYYGTNYQPVEYFPRWIA